MVVDSSVLLCLFLKEPHSDWVQAQLNKNQKFLCMSTVNLAEVVMVLEKLKVARFEKIKEEILSSTINFIPPDTRQALIAAKTRNQYAINFGDCFAYALAIVNKCSILTLDTDFKKTDIDVVLP